MLEKILTETFKKTLRLIFADIKNQQDRMDEEQFIKDEVRIREKLLDSIEPYNADMVLEKDFQVAAVDGSGTDSLMMLDDIRIHLLSTATVILDSNTCKKTNRFCPVERITLESELGEQPHLDAHWHSKVRGDAEQKLAEALAYIYPFNAIAELILPFLQDYTNGRIASIEDISDSELAPYATMFQKIESLISRAQFLTSSAVHEELRTASEYAAAKRVLTSRFTPKYLLLDGAMYIYIRNYPAMPSGFMLRDICSLARSKNVILCAVSKNHTIPFAHRIASIAQATFGKEAKWFCHLPSKDDPDGGLRIYEDRTYIPPKLAVPYLFSFSPENRPSRIDFDRIWWLANIFVAGNAEATRANEKALFREIEFMSRDARWYGYPVALALAHEACKLSYDDIRLAREICRDVRFEMGVETRRIEPLRADYNL